MNQEIEKAKAAGFTKVMTLAGLMPLDEWFKRVERNDLTFDPNSRALVGEWRTTYPIEKEKAIELGYDLKTLQARDCFPLN